MGDDQGQELARIETPELSLAKDCLGSSCCEASFVRSAEGVKISIPDHGSNVRPHCGCFRKERLAIADVPYLWLASARPLQCKGQEQLDRDQERSAPARPTRRAAVLAECGVITEVDKYRSRVRDTLAGCGKRRKQVTS